MVEKVRFSRMISIFMKITQNQYLRLGIIICGVGIIAIVAFPEIMAETMQNITTSIPLDEYDGNDGYRDGVLSPINLILSLVDEVLDTGTLACDGDGVISNPRKTADYDKGFLFGALTDAFICLGGAFIYRKYRSNKQEKIVTNELHKHVEKLESLSIEDEKGNP